MADPAFLELPMPLDGVDLSSAPHQLPPTRSGDAINLLLHEQGKMPLRGGLVRGLASSPTPKQRSGGAWIDYTVGNRIPVALVPGGHSLYLGLSQGGRYHPWRWFESNAAAALPTVALGPVALASQAASSQLTTVAKGYYGPSPHYAVYKEKLWWVNYDRFMDGTIPTDITYAGKTHYERRLVYTDDGLDAANSSVTTAPANVPSSNMGLANYADRLWALGGASPSASNALKPNTLWFTNIDADPTSTSSWQTNGVNNFLTVGAETSTDWGMQLVSTSRFLLVLKRHSVWVLTGNASSNFSLRQTTASTGLVDPRAVAAVGDTVFFLTGDGLMRFDGVEVESVSKRVDPKLVPLLAQWASTSAPNTGFAVIQRLPNSYLLIVVGEDGVGAHGAFLYHVPSGRWMEVESTTTAAPGTGLAPWSGLTGEIGGRVWGAHHNSDAIRLSEMSYVTNPGRLGLAGSTKDSRDRDQAPTAATEVNIPLRCRLAPVRGAAPNSRLHLNRVGLSAFWQTQDNPAGATGYPQLNLRRYTVAGLQAETDPIQNAVVSVTPRQVTANEPDERPQIVWAEQRSEATDLILEITREGTLGNQTLERAELVDAMLELQSPTHRRRT